MTLSNWETEEDNGEEAGKPSSIEKFKTGRPDGYDIRKDEVIRRNVKTMLVLVDSNTENWGLVEDTLDKMDWEPGKGEIVGTWSRVTMDNLIYLGVETSLASLQNRTTLMWAKYAEERKVEKATGKKPRKPKAAKAEDASIPAPELSVEEKMKFNSLRARLMKSKGK